MHALKLTFLVVLTLVIMRIVGLALARLLRCWFPAAPSVVILGSNIGGLLVFLGFLYWDRLPGELFDPAAGLFGLCVYALFALSDFFWPRIRGKQGARRSPKKDQPLVG
jgi:hypothetical protein